MADHNRTIESLRDPFIRLIAFFILIVSAFAFTLDHDHQAYSAYCQTAEHQKTETCEPEKPFVEKLLGDPAAFFTAVLAVLTLVLAVVGVFQVVFLVRADTTARIAANAAKLSAEIAERTLVSTQRPFVAVSETRGDIGGNDFGHFIIIRISITNKGTTTATNCSGWINYGFFSDSPDAYINDPPNDEARQAGPIFSNQIYTLDAVNLYGSGVEKLLKLREKLYVWGRLDYGSMIEGVEPNITRFCYEVVLVRPDFFNGKTPIPTERIPASGPLLIFRVHTRGNEST